MASDVFHRHGEYGHAHADGDVPHAHQSGDARSDPSELEVGPQADPTPSGGWHRPPPPRLPVTADHTSTKPGMPWYPDDGRGIGAGKTVRMWSRDRAQVGSPLTFEEVLLTKSAARTGSGSAVSSDPDLIFRESYYRAMAADPSISADLRAGYADLAEKASKAARESMVPAGSGPGRRWVRDRDTGKVTTKSVSVGGGWGPFGSLKPQRGA